MPMGIGRGHERTPAKADGIHLENAHNVTFQQNVIFEFESPRLDWFGDCISIDEYSSVVKRVERYQMHKWRVIQCNNNKISNYIK